MNNLRLVTAVKSSILPKFCQILVSIAILIRLETPTEYYLVAILAAMEKEKTFKLIKHVKAS